MISFVRGEISVRNWIAVLSLASVAAGALPSWTSQESSVLDWEEMASVDAPKVKVRLESDRPFINLEGENIKIKGRWSQPELAISFHRVGNRAVWLAGGSKLAETSLEEGLAVSGSKMSVNDLPVPKTLILRAKSSGTIDVYAHLPLEKYVEGVLAGEMPSHWPLESLKAQAVAARSYLLALRQNRKHKNFDIDSSQYDQVFHAVEDLPKANQEQIHRAVSESQGLVLRTSDEYPMQAYFHADCGGVTENAATVWGNAKSPNFSGGKVNSSCPFNPGHQWVYRVAKSRLARMVGLKGVTKVVASEVRSSGRILALNVSTSLGKVKSIQATKLRRELGFNNLKSTLFEIADKGEIIEFQGRGWGHGVGLCQWGSKMMAENGSSFIEILGHYYPQARIVPVSRGFQIGQRK